jgi:hypothetical protein
LEDRLSCGLPVLVVTVGGSSGGNCHSGLYYLSTG